MKFRLFWKLVLALWASMLLSMFAALPIDKLDRLALKNKLDEIGQARPVALA